MHAEKLDPAEKARREMIDWVGTSIEEIARQVEATEAELESLTAGKKKKKGDERANELEELNERRTWHIGRMEIVQRMLENGSLGTEAVEGIQEDIKYFIESNAVSFFFSFTIQVNPLGRYEGQDAQRRERRLHTRHHYPMSRYDTAPVLPVMPAAYASL